MVQAQGNGRQAIDRLWGVHHRPNRGDDGILGRYGLDAHWLCGACLVSGYGESAFPGKRIRAGVVRFVRDQDDIRPEPDSSLIDAMLLRKFPGRTLDELDRMDWMRYQRAMEAQRILDIEGKRAAFTSGNLESLSADEWLVVQENDRLLEEYT